MGKNAFEFIGPTKSNHYSKITSQKQHILLSNIWTKYTQAKELYDHTFTEFGEIVSNQCFKIGNKHKKVYHPLYLLLYSIYKQRIGSSSHGKSKWNVVKRTRSKNRMIQSFLSKSWQCDMFKRYTSNCTLDNDDVIHKYY